MNRPDCMTCRGACCESLLLTPYLAAQFETEYIETRGKRLDNGWVELKVRCPKLAHDGMCSIYAVRPLACQNYPVGGSACLAAMIRGGRQ